MDYDYDDDYGDNDDDDYDYHYDDEYDYYDDEDHHHSPHHHSDEHGEIVNIEQMHSHIVALTYSEFCPPISVPHTL